MVLTWIDPILVKRYTIHGVSHVEGSEDILKQKDCETSYTHHLLNDIS